MAWPIEAFFSLFTRINLREAYKPKDLKVAPQELYESEVFEYLSKITLVRNWMSQWLNYVRGYSTVAMHSGVSFQDFFSAPVVTSRWNTTREDPNRIRFGLMGRLYDEVAIRGLDFRVPILEYRTGLSSVVLLGGVSGTGFLVFAEGQH